MTKIEVFKEQTLEELKISVNDFLSTLKAEDVVSVTTNEDEYNYKATIVYNIEGPDG